MKKLLALLGALLLAVAVNAQTNTPPPLPPAPVVVDTNLPPTLPEHVSTWLNFLSNTSSNWTVAPFVVFVNDDIDSVGGGIAAMYSLNQYALTGLRMDYVNDELWMPSINVTLQLPIRVANKLTVSPFVISGLATPLGEREEDNGEAVGIFGGGLAVQVKKNFGLVYDSEIWTGFSGVQHRFGIYWRF